MDLIFNELSLKPLASNKTEAYQRVFALVKMFKKANAFDFKAIRFHQNFHEIFLFNEYSLQDYCNETGNRTLTAILLGLRRYPFIHDNSDEEEKYIENAFFLKKHNTEIKCQGLAAAYLYSTSGIGFYAESYWETFLHQLIIKNDDGDETKDFVACISLEEHLGSDEFITWLESISRTQLKTSKIDPKDKTVKLRDDHGKDVLMAFAQKLVNSPYVEKVINSLPFNPNARELVKRVSPDGKIELVLTNTDQGLGLIVQTTGRNLKETTEIAEIISQSLKQF
ncbi:MAG: hypothetical protein HQ517_14745 [SAR324 cluster bacterium]|nr:hypothetical protein [SAR324 cluster bacterium]